MSDEIVPSDAQSLSTEDERRLNRGQYRYDAIMQNIVSVAEGVAEIMPMLEKGAKETKAVADRIREELKTIDHEKCIDHEEIELPVDFDATFSKTWFNEDRKLIVVYGVCPVCVEARKSSLVNEKKRKMGIPDKVAHATFDNFDVDEDSKRKALAKAKRQCERDRGFLILRGEPGTGKSHLASAILQSKGGLFVTLADMIGQLRESYEKGGQEEVVNKFRDAKILVLDEVTVEVKGVDIPAFLYRVLAHRYDRDMLTVVTSNDSLDDILAIFGRRLADRMRQNYEVATMEWKSRRVRET